jgi:hypothetical protein
VTVSVIGGGKRSTQRKPPTCRKSLTNFITCCIEYITPDVHIRHTRTLLLYSAHCSLFSGSVEQTFIKTALSILTSVTNDCIKFVPRTSQKDYVEITKGDG